jgi:drug/metabolite transporter (DMT)-like permease
MPPFPFAGELAALATSILFSLGPIFFTLAGRQVGSVVVNRTRLVFASLILISVHLVLFGSIAPFDASPDRWLWLSLSGIIGLVIGDAMLFQALLNIGPRLTMLIFSTSPIIAALLAFGLDGERLLPVQIVGMAVTLAGVGWVITERNEGAESDIDPRTFLIGVLFALGGSAGQALGLYTARLGIYGDFPTFSAQLIRMLSATLVLWLLTFAQGRAGHTITTLRQNLPAVRTIAIATFFGPFLGIFFSLVAIRYTSLGIASTLQSLPPVFLIPIGYFLFGEKVTPRNVAGTLIALAGVAVLFLV